MKTLQFLFDDERFDLVPSDLAAGLVLLQQEDVNEQRSIEVTQTAPLELLKQGLYFNSYAQSAFGWYRKQVLVGLSSAHSPIAGFRWHINIE